MQGNQQIFQSQQLQKYLTYEAHFFFSTLEVSCRYLKWEKNGAKIYGFLDNLI